MATRLERWFLKGKNKVAIRLWRWFLIHVGVALFPILASLLVPLFQNPPQRWEPGAGEVLFFSLMLSAIVFGDVFEWLSINGFTSVLLLIGAVFFLCSLGSALLYGMYVYHNTLRRGDSERVLLYSFVLAGFCVVLGSFVEIAFSNVERKKKSEGTVEGRD